MTIGQPALADILLGSADAKTSGPDESSPLVKDCVALIESHVASRSGLKGMALKTGLAMAKAAKPQILPRAAKRLLPEFAVALDPLYQSFVASNGGDFPTFLESRKPDAVMALLDVADRKIAESPNASLKAVYARLRKGAEAEVAALLPGLAMLIAARLP